MEEKLLQIRYSMNLDEISEGFKLFQKKYQMKRTIIFTVVYAIALVLGIDFLIRDYTNFYGYMLVGISIGLIFFDWYRPVIIRKKMIASISSLAEESYITDIFSSRIQITTEILNEEAEQKDDEADGTENSDSGEADNNDEQQENVVTNLYFGSDLLDAMENERMFLLFVNRSLIYIYPKRCLSDDEQNKLREIFTEKAIL